MAAAGGGRVELAEGEEIEAVLERDEKYEKEQALLNEFEDDAAAAAAGSGRNLNKLGRGTKTAANVLGYWPGGKTPDHTFIHHLLTYTHIHIYIPTYTCK